MLTHKHLIIRAEVNNPLTCTDNANNWLYELIKKIDMKVLMGPYSTYSDMVGNRGLTAVAIIETSNICVHIWDEVSPALVQIDVYSCKDFEPKDVIDHLQIMEPTDIKMKFLDREHDLIEIPV